MSSNSQARARRARAARKAKRAARQRRATQAGNPIIRRLRERLPTPRFGPMPALQVWAARHAVAAALSAVILGATLLAVRWVFLVPIYEAPDEPTHLDYAFSIYSSAHLIDGRGVLVGGGVHPYTAYLLQVSHQAQIAFQPLVGAPPNYGTASYYASIDRGAPALPRSWHPSYAPLLLAIYPFGYYALVALWMGLIHLFTHSLVALFFGARILSALLLSCSLGLSYGITRELRIDRRLGVLLVGVIGFFPLTSFVASYVQPDNLSLTLTSFCLYMALRVRRRTHDIRMLAMLVADRLFAPATRLTWKRLVACLAPPSLLLGLVQIWVVWHARAPYSAAIGSRAVTGEMNYATAHDAWRQGLPVFLQFVLTGLNNAYTDYFHGGTTFISFLGDFGWLDTPLIIHSLQLTQQIQGWAMDLTLVVLSLTAVRMIEVAWRLLRLARKSRWRLALRMATWNPVYNSMFLFTAFMFLLYVLTSNTFGAQGRNWFPYILPIFLIGVVYAPHAIPIRWARIAVSRFILLCLLLYTTVGSYYAVQSVTDRYYATFRAAQLQSVHPLNDVAATSKSVTKDRTDSAAPINSVQRAQYDSDDLWYSIPGISD